MNNIYKDEYTIYRLSREIDLLLENHLSIRDIAKVMSRSKTAVHKDLTIIIKRHFSTAMCKIVSTQLKTNFANRGHISQVKAHAHK